MKNEEKSKFFNPSFLDIFWASKKEQFDFLYLSVEHLEARRNHTELLWSQQDALQGNPENIDDKIDENKEKTEKKI